MESLKCPICTLTLTAPIFHCKNLHNVCGSCILDKNIDKCPSCDKSITKRNYQIEKIIEELGSTHLVSINCKYKTQGCRSKLDLATKPLHETECKYKKRQCEGKTFCKWKCDWSGNFDELLSHFVDEHKITSIFKWKEDSIDLKINFYDTVDLKIISFLDGKEIFWYKHKVDAKNERMYWVFQYVGPHDQAKEYLYEFEIRDGPVRKLKVEEYCKSDTIEAEEIFKARQCATVSFDTIKSYLNKNGYINIKYRIKRVYIAQPNVLNKSATAHNKSTPERGP